LFPLPNVVLFPMGLLPLHVFEPRYRLMMRDCLQKAPHQRLICMTLLRGDYREKYYTNHADIYPIACVGRLLRHEELPDGRFNLILQGLSRVRVVGEDRTGEYRVARLEKLTSTDGSDWAEEVGAERIGVEDVDSIRNRMRKVVDNGSVAQLSCSMEMAKWFDADLSVGQLADLMAYYLLGSRTNVKQALLSELDGPQRACRLLSYLKEMGVPMETCGAGTRHWPPFASDN